MILGLSQIPSKYLSKTISGFDFYHNSENENEYNLIKEYYDKLTWKVSNGLLLIGPTGTGKTHLISGVIRKCINLGMWTLYVDQLSINAEIKEFHTIGGYRQFSPYKLSFKAKVF